MTKSLKVGIIGSGIQGVSNALFLQKKGFDVTIFDRDEPGSPAASYGNAGHFSPYASLSLNRTDILLDVPAMLMSSSGPLALKWNYVPKMIPWFVKFLLNTSKNKMMHTAKNMHQILDLALPAYDELFDEIELEGLVENKGILYIWNDKDLKSRDLEIRVRDELGVKQQLVSKDEIHDLEPNIKPFYHAGVYYPYARHARNPKKILLKFFELFLKKGGKFEKKDIKDIQFNADGSIAAITSGGAPDISGFIAKEGVKDEKLAKGIKSDFGILQTNIKRLQSEIPKTPTGFYGNVVSGLNVFADQFSQFKDFAIDSKFANKASKEVDEYLDTKGITKDAQQRAKVKSSIINLSYLLAKIAEPGNPKYSEGDIKRQLDRINWGGSRDQIMAGLQRILEEEYVTASAEFKKYNPEGDFGYEDPFKGIRKKQKEDEIDDPLGFRT